MSQLGIGVMLSMLTDNSEGIAILQGALNKTIAALKLIAENGLFFTMDDGTKFKLFDDGQSCCESRYMTTDDDLPYYIGSTLLGAELAEAPSQESEWGDHEVQFLNIKTSKGVFTMETHNEHNGYYGGFAVRAALVTE